MPTIFSPHAVFSGNIPEREDLLEAQTLTHQALLHAHEQGDVEGATSYGSVHANNPDFDSASDLDWLIIMKNQRRMFSSHVLPEIRSILDTRNISWSSPVTSMETLQHGLHHIGPLLYGIHQSQNRLIVGRDPLHICNELGIVAHDPERIRNILAATSRYALESMAIAQPGNRLGALQQSVDTFQETYRNMLVYQAGKEETSVPLDFAEYQRMFAGRVSEETMKAGCTIAEFISKYRRCLRQITSEQALHAEHANMRRDFSSLLKRQASIPSQAAVFVTGNCAMLCQEDA